jgi:lysophospholipase L1-like esterase
LKIGLRRVVTAATAALLVLAATGAGTAGAAVHARPDGSAVDGRAMADVPWTGTWATAMQGTGQTFTDETVRQIVRTSIGGSSARIRLSNRYGAEPVTLRNVHIAASLFNHDVAAATDRQVTFNGDTSVTIPPGGEVASDPVEFEVPPESDVAVSFHVPGTAVATQHHAAHQVNWRAPGDQAGEFFLRDARTFGNYTFLAGLDVRNPEATGAVVAFGASITDQESSTHNTNRRWPNRLATRLNLAGHRIGVLNMGISGNNLLADGGGEAGVKRFQRDVLDQPGVRWVIISDDPINDIINRRPPARDLIDGLRRLVDAAHAEDVKVLCSTLTPVRGFSRWDDDKETVRQEINDFLRGPSSGCDAIVDQATATGDPKDPRAFLPGYDAGDHLHPNDAGMQAIADAVPLAAFGRPAGAASVDLAAHRRVETSSVQGDLAGRNAVDGDSTTRWAAADSASPQWLAVDLGAEKEIKRVRPHWYAPVQRYRIQTSPDGRAWTTVASQESGVRTIEDFELSVKARYVRVLATQTVTPYGYSLYDLGVYGDAPAPAASLRATFGNTGVTSDSATDRGDLDGGGATYSAEALASAGLRPGGTVTHGGVSFTWPATANGSGPDNTVANGQRVAVGRAGRTLGFLAASSYGRTSGAGEITYTDGSVQRYSVTVPDWFGDGTGDVVAAAPYQNRPGGVRYDQPAYVFFVGVPLHAGKTVQSVRLPAISDAAVAGTPSLHVFALSVDAHAARTR